MLYTHLIKNAQRVRWFSALVLVSYFWHVTGFRSKCPCAVCRCVILRNLTGLQASPNSSMKGTRTQQNTFFLARRIRQKEFTYCFYHVLFNVISFAIGIAKTFLHLDWWKSFVFTCAEWQHHWNSSLFLVPVFVVLFLFLVPPPISIIQGN